MATKSKKNWYFKKEHEDAIVKYAENKDVEIRTELYVTLISPVFDELITNIIYTYKFHTLPNVDTLKEECKIWLTTILDKFDKNKGSKAFNYFTVVIRNWFIQKAKRNSKMIRREQSSTNISQKIEEKYFSTENPYEEERERSEFFLALGKEMDSWDKGHRARSLRENDLKVIDAIRTVFKDVEQLEIYTKKGTYTYLREITNLNTKQVTRSLKKFKERYAKFKSDWDNGLLDE